MLLQDPAGCFYKALPDEHFHVLSVASRSVYGYTNITHIGIVLFVWDYTTWCGAFIDTAGPPEEEGVSHSTSQTRPTVG